MVILRRKFTQFNSVQLLYILELFDAGIRQNVIHSQLPKVRQSRELGDYVCG